MTIDGGCLCGAVRYTSDRPSDYASYCHCSMCRKATGAPYAGFVQVRGEALRWRGTPSSYASSPTAIRRFCGTCGTPLTFEADGVVFVTLGSLDAPENVRVNCHTYTATALPGHPPEDGLLRHPGPAGGKGGRDGT